MDSVALQYWQSSTAPIFHGFRLPAITGSEYGWLGVYLFFVLSGFPISSILLESCEKEHHFKIFYFRSALHIFPPYYLGVFVYICVSLALRTRARTECGRDTSSTMPVC
jgi:peptidoglycan/LPS O-acetylase OafA/YrhL